MNLGYYLSRVLQYILQPEMDEKAQVVINHYWKIAKLIKKMEDARRYGHR